jgi:hemerythrin-like domain-containing protein
VQASRLRRAAAGGDASARLLAAREFVLFFRNEERVHLRDEEEELFPLLLRHVQSQPPLREARAQHMQLEGFARQLEIAVAAGAVDRETLDAAGELLDTHIRLEERELFPLIEELVPDDQLRRLGLADRYATCAVRPPPPTSEA